MASVKKNCETRKERDRENDSDSENEREGERERVKVTQTEWVSERLRQCVSESDRSRGSRDRERV